MKRHVLISFIALLLLPVMACRAVSTLLPATPTSTLTPTNTPRPTNTPSPTSKPATELQLPTPAGPADEAYLDLILQLPDMDPDFDFTALRLAFAESSGYDPYGFNRMTKISDMYEAYDTGDYDLAISLAEEILEEIYISIDGHLIAYLAYQELDQTEKADYHSYVAEGLVSSILDSGDGETPETAYQVVTIKEEYVVLDFMSIEYESRGMEELNGHSYDVFNCIDKKSDTTYDLYFNIDIPYGWLGDSFNL